LRTGQKPTANNIFCGKVIDPSFRQKVIKGGSHFDAAKQGQSKEKDIEDMHGRDDLLSKTNNGIRSDV
jgi:hypothetical protein